MKQIIVHSGNDQCVEIHTPEWVKNKEYINDQ